MTEATAATPATAHVDPVCGMTVDPADAAGSFAYQGRTYYFCNPSCLERFSAAPEEFLMNIGVAKAQAPTLIHGAGRGATAPRGRAR